MIVYMFYTVQGSFLPRIIKHILFTIIYLLQEQKLNPRNYLK
jgi:hypothetical protein